ncbi:hypothetical protein BDQ17DRAFT_1320941 [Cyathus striatus]|nr:hypothetical protein BDQ17DRAFT_1320941 [Cyathus striatus]
MTRGMKGLGLSSIINLDIRDTKPLSCLAKEADVVASSKGYWNSEVKLLERERLQGHSDLTWSFNATRPSPALESERRNERIDDIDACYCDSFAFFLDGDLVIMCGHYDKTLARPSRLLTKQLVFLQEGTKKNQEIVGFQFRTCTSSKTVEVAADWSSPRAIDSSLISSSCEDPLVPIGIIFASQGGICLSTLGVYPSSAIHRVSLIASSALRSGYLHRYVVCYLPNSTDTFPSYTTNNSNASPPYTTISNPLLSYTSSIDDSQYPSISHSPNPYITSQNGSGHSTESSGWGRVGSASMAAQDVNSNAMRINSTSFSKHICSPNPPPQNPNLSPSSSSNSNCPLPQDSGFTSAYARDLNGYIGLLDEQRAAGLRFPRYGHNGAGPESLMYGGRTYRITSAYAGDLNGYMGFLDEQRAGSLRFPGYGRDSAGSESPTHTSHANASSGLNKHPNISNCPNQAILKAERIWGIIESTFFQTLFP